MNALSIFNADTTAITYTNKKGAALGITAEGALFKGGAALTALKDVALQAAVLKACNGRYRAAHDVIVAAFPSVGKACDKLLGDGWSKKAHFETLCNAVSRETPKEGKEFSAKQRQAMHLVHLLQKQLFAVDQEGETVDM